MYHPTSPMKTKMMVIVIVLSVFVSPVFGSDIEVTIYVDGDYRPFSFSDKGEARGMYIDVLKTAFSRMEGFAVTMKPVPWKRGKKMMETGKGFGLTPAFFHGHDWPYLYPYSLPFYTETIVAVCQDEVLSTSRPNWPQDYVGLRIGNVAGFDGWGGEEFHGLVRQGKIQYEEARGSRENILKLAHRRLDCIMMGDKAFDFLFRSLKATGEYSADLHASLAKGAIIGQDPVYIGYSRPAREAGDFPFQMEFMQAFDSVIYKMAKDGEIQRIMDAYQE